MSKNFDNMLIFFKWVVSLSTGVGVYMWSMTYLKDIKNHLNATNESAGLKEQSAEFRSKFLETIYHHAVGIELSIMA